MYGQLIGGGANGLEAVFKLTPSGNSWNYMDLYDVDDVHGADPFGDVLEMSS